MRALATVAVGLHGVEAGLDAVETDGQESDGEGEHEADERADQHRAARDETGTVERSECDDGTDGDDRAGHGVAE